MTTLVVTAAILQAVILLSNFNGHQLFAMADGTFNNRFYVCDCQEETINCTGLSNQTSPMGYMNESTTHTRLYKCMCRTDLKCLGNYNQSTYSVIASESFNLTQSYECSFGELVLNCSADYNETAWTNSTVYILENNSTIHESFTNITKNFYCFSVLPDGCLECRESSNDGCTDSISTTSHYNSSSPIPTHLPGATAHTGPNTSTSNTATPKIVPTTTLPTASTTTATITLKTSPTTAATVEAQSEKIDVKSMVIISVIVGLCLLLGVGVCLYLINQRRKMNINYKSSREKIIKNMSASNNINHESDNINYESDNTHPKRIFD